MLIFQCFTTNEGNVIEITSKDNFEEEVLQAKLPVIAKFETEWCGACKIMEPIYAKASQDFEGKIKFVKVDADHLKEIAQEYKIAGIPAFIFFKDGKDIEKIEGGMDEEDFVEVIKEVFKFV